MIKSGRDLSLGVFGGFVVALVSAYWTHSKVPLWIGGGVFVTVWVLIATVNRKRELTRGLRILAPYLKEVWLARNWVEVEVGLPFRNATDFDIRWRADEFTIRLEGEGAASNPLPDPVEGVVPDGDTVAVSKDPVGFGFAGEEQALHIDYRLYYGRSLRRGGGQFNRVVSGEFRLPLKAGQQEHEKVVAPVEHVRSPEDRKVTKQERDQLRARTAPADSP
jgi:hypothetical protein